jgi:hypothetical protein
MLGIKSMPVLLKINEENTTLIKYENIKWFCKGRSYYGK